VQEKLKLITWTRRLPFHSIRSVQLAFVGKYARRLNETGVCCEWENCSIKQFFFASFFGVCASFCEQQPNYMKIKKRK
jgi:hypothetical protein